MYKENALSFSMMIFMEAPKFNVFKRNSIFLRKMGKLLRSEYSTITGEGKEKVENSIILISLHFCLKTWRNLKKKSTRDKETL